MVANNHVDLTELFGSPDDICPICLDAMPVQTWRGKERCRSLCCGKFMCPDCMAGLQNHQSSLGQEVRDAVNRNDRVAAERAVRNLESSVTCPLCRARLPCTAEESFAASLENANKGHAFAQHAVATKYESGNGTRKNVREAVKWFKKSTEQGHPWSPSSYGYILQQGEGGVQRDIAKAKQLYERSIESGHPQGYWYLGCLYEKGIGVQKNEREAVRLYRIGADMGLDVAQCSLGNCYDFGMGVPVNYEEALKWYRASAEQGKNATAMNNVGAKLMQLGQIKYGNEHSNIPPGSDPLPQAYFWFKQAAKLGDRDGAYTSSQIEANCKSHCFGCKKNEHTATLNRCAKCKLYRYCGRDCQVKHWKAGHKKDCVKAG